jgi:hypothetical protein
MYALGFWGWRIYEYYMMVLLFVALYPPAVQGTVAEEHYRLVFMNMVCVSSCTRIRVARLPVGEFVLDYVQKWS